MPSALATTARTHSDISPRPARRPRRPRRPAQGTASWCPTWFRWVSAGPRKPRPASGSTARPALFQPPPSTARRRRFPAARTRRRVTGRSPAVPVRFDWGYFPDTVPTFPAELTDAMIREGEAAGHSRRLPRARARRSSTSFGEEHIRTGKPICYTSADSVFQIAAHEAHFGLERLYEFCKIGAPAGRPAEHRPGDRAALHRRERRPTFERTAQPPRLRRAAARADAARPADRRAAAR